MKFTSVRMLLRDTHGAIVILGSQIDLSNNLIGITTHELSLANHRIHLHQLHQLIIQLVHMVEILTSLDGSYPSPD
jgi:hypothetical protein